MSISNVDPGLWQSALNPDVKLQSLAHQYQLFLLVLRHENILFYTCKKLHVVGLDLDLSSQIKLHKNMNKWIDTFSINNLSEKHPKTSLQQNSNSLCF